MTQTVEERLVRIETHLDGNVEKMLEEIKEIKENINKITDNFVTKEHFQDKIDLVTIKCNQADKEQDRRIAKIESIIWRVVWFVVLAVGASLLHWLVLQ